YPLFVSGFQGQLSVPKIKIRITEAVKRTGMDIADYISKHVSGDWGSVTDSMRAANVAALMQGKGTVRSVYRASQGWLFVNVDVDINANWNITTFLTAHDVETFLQGSVLNFAE
ncbi:MAG: hypothetical protein JXB30_17960, partial [Anaerolineae bacterium]|nr:hypothetical protein [Anaerolineae bacterium]